MYTLDKVARPACLDRPMRLGHHTHTTTGDSGDKWVPRQLGNDFNKHSYTDRQTDRQTDS